VDSGASPSDPAIRDVLAGVGPRLRALRRQRSATLADLAADTGVSESTLSRLESSHRHPSLELLLRLARVHRVPLDTLVDAPATGDPRVHPRPLDLHGMTVLPLTSSPGGIQAYKLLVPVRGSEAEPDLQAHGGHTSLYVLSGQLRLVLTDQELTLGTGEVAEIDNSTPHWFAALGPRPAEVLALVGAQGEQMRLRVRASERVTRDATAVPGP
jgi:transcriptional regulator with XRE-family HTH domain